MKDLPRMFSTELSKLLCKIDFDTFVISDTHFNHKGITEWESCRAEEMVKDGYDIEGLDEDGLIETHNAWLVHRWNNVVGPNDLVLHLGDFAFRGMQEIIPQLNGVKILILGNHDRKGPNVYKGFAHVIRGSYTLVGDKVYIAESNDPLFSSLKIQLGGSSPVLFSHYPATTREHRYKIIDGEKVWMTPINTRIDEIIEICDEERILYNFHGHTHSKSYDSTGSVCFVNVSLEANNFEPTRIIDVLGRL